jgi:DNA polymerase-3 subunit epsilon
VEIGIVVISADGVVQAEYETLVNPVRDMGPFSIHQIAAADVLRAPTFADVGGDVLEILATANVIAGHNVSFDKNFLVKEFERLGVSIPEVPLLCICRLFGRSSLEACCHELAIPFEGVPHQALSDARSTARIVAFLCSDDPHVLDDVRLKNVQWPFLPALRTQCFCRQHAEMARAEPPHFLRRIVKSIHHNVDAETPHVLAYMALIDRALEDRTIDANEEDVLVEAVRSWQLSASQVAAAHTQYLHSLAVVALADGVVSDTERRDLHLVANLLGQDDSTLDKLLESAATDLASASCATVAPHAEGSLSGQRVCFTGELQSTIGGYPITRELAEALATQAGMVVASNVTKALDVLVVADPNTQSGKAKKARGYGIRILSDAVFWKLAGITVD